MIVPGVLDFPIDVRNRWIMEIARDAVHYKIYRGGFGKKLRNANAAG